MAVGGRPAAWGAPVLVRAGELLEVGAATAGVRSYLAVGGGVAVGARARQPRPPTCCPAWARPPLADGMVLPLGAPYGPSRARGRHAAAASAGRNSCSG